MICVDSLTCDCVMCRDRRASKRREQRLRERQARWPLPGDPEWRERAACLDTIPLEWFFSDQRGRRVATDETYLAKRACGPCPVRTECLAHALHHEEKGVWGGLTELERRQMLYLPSAYVLPLTTRPRRNHRAVLCWCEREMVEVHKVAIGQGLTVACGHPDCGPQ